jgi:hypothetical protein
MDLKELFGTDPLTFEQFEEKTKGLKLVDLNEGGYISKEKYTADVKKHKDNADKLTADLNDLKNATDGDDGLKNQVASLTKERDDAVKERDTLAAKFERDARVAKAKEKVSSEKLARLAVLDAENLVGDDMDFDAALDKVIADDPDYSGKDEKKPVGKFSTGKETKGEPANPDPNAEAFRKGLGLPEPGK